MFFVSLLCFALFSQAIAQESRVVRSQGENALIASAEAAFATQFPLPYKIFDLIRIVLGISKSKMMNFAMKAMEVRAELQELWELMIDMFRKETPKPRMSTTNHQYRNQIPHNTQLYYTY